MISKEKKKWLDQYQYKRGKIEEQRQRLNRLEEVEFEDLRQHLSEEDDIEPPPKNVWQYFEKLVSGMRGSVRENP